MSSRRCSRSKLRARFNLFRVQIIIRLSCEDDERYLKRSINFLLYSKGGESCGMNGNNNKKKKRIERICFMTSNGGGGCSAK